MKKWLIISAIIIILCSTIVLLYNKITTLEQKLSIAENNTKALLLENSELNSTSRILKLTIEQLTYSKDSISKTLVKTLEVNKINKKKISQLQYMLETNFRVDTVKFRDTLFLNRIDLDTLIKDDRWYRLDMKLKHPNTIIVNPTFTNEYTTVFTYKKETIMPPKKFFLCRWFQKKHYVTEVKVFNNNPYSITDTLRFIDIVK